MELLRVERRDSRVFVIWMNNGENRVGVQFLRELRRAIEGVVKDGARCIVTASETRFYSNGLDLDLSDEQRRETLQEMVGVVRLLLKCEVPTVALVNGHAYGAGLMLALAHDYRVMGNRGWVCVPAIELGIFLPVPLVQLVQHKLGNRAAAAVLLRGEKMSGAEAQRIGLVDVLSESMDGLVDVGVAFGDKIGREPAQREVYAFFKSAMYAPLLESFGELKAKL